MVALDDKDTTQDAENKSMSVENYMHWAFNQFDSNRDGTVLFHEMLHYYESNNKNSYSI